MTDSVLRNTTDRTDHITASFIQELMRRAIQNAITHDGDALALAQPSTNPARDTVPVAGGLNRKLLGEHAEM